MKKLILLLSISGLITSAAFAQAPDPDTTAKHFIIMASIGNLQEINSGKQAVEKAVRPDVKSFGQMMINDHSKAEEKLMRLANSKNIQIPMAATATPPRDLNLEKESGNDFDRLYIHSMLVSHGSTVKMFENYAITGKDPDVREFARQTLPTLKAHLAAIKAIDEKYKYLTAK